MINRDYYLNELIKNKDNGLAKVLTGLKETGKSYLLRKIFKSYLLDNGATKENIIYLNLDKEDYKEFRNPIVLFNQVKLLSKESSKCYLLISDAQKITTIVNPTLTNGKVIKATNEEDVITFTDIILSLSNIDNLDVYVSINHDNNIYFDKALETLIRNAVNINVLPLSYKEVISLKEDEEVNYLNIGGLPVVINNDNQNELLDEIYNEDIINELNNNPLIRKNKYLNDLIEFIAENPGNIVNSLSIRKDLKEKKNILLNKDTIDKYLNELTKIKLLKEVKRMDYKSSSLLKGGRGYYFTDLGLLHLLNNKEDDSTLRNLILNDLVFKGYNVYSVYFNQVEKDKARHSIMKAYTIDFYAYNDKEKMYIQVVSSLTEENKELITRPFRFIKDGGKKIVLVNNNDNLVNVNKDIEVISIKDFLLK